MVVGAMNPTGIETVVVNDLIAALRNRFPGAEIDYQDLSENEYVTALYSVRITPPSESPFTVTASVSGHAFSLDGLEGQDARAAAAIRDAWHTNHRIVAVASGAAWFVELLPGMASEDIMNGHRPFSELTE